MNNLEVISKLALEAVAEDKRKDTQIFILASQLDDSKLSCQLLDDKCNELLTTSKEIESMLSLSKLNNKSLLGELSDMQKGLEAVESTNELLSDRDRLLQDEINRLQKVERENEVLKKDLKKSQEQVKRAKSAPPKKAKPVKIGAGVAQLTLEKKRLNKYISELLAWGQISPQYIDTLQHSTQGRLDIIDLKHEDADVSELGETDKQIKSCQRFIVINNYNDIKMITTVVGEEGLCNPIAPEGHKVTIDSEINDYISNHITKSAVINKQVLESIKTYG